MANHPKIKGEPEDEKMVQDYVSRWYSIRYSGSGFLYHSRIVTEMLDGIKFKDGKYSDKVLDVGCGIGFVSQLYPNFDITGIDISDGMLEKNPYKWIKAPAEKIPFEDNTFDFVICRSLLHHLENTTVGLREMVRVLKKGGKFICWDPNAGFFATFIRKLFQKTKRFSHLHHSFNDIELYNLIKESGLKVEWARYIGFLAYPLTGFPDIFNFKVPIWLVRKLIQLDNLLSYSPFKRIAWSLMIKATKE